MNACELLGLIRRRLGRKARQAEEAFVCERCAKTTLNCVNHGRKLGDNVFHCKINAMGLYEERASQCWNQKASICPVFERREEDELRREFRRMNPNELAIRWPSLGELIRFEALLSGIDELKEDQDAEVSQPGMRSLGDVRLPTAGEKRSSSDSGHVSRHIGPYGSSNDATEASDGIEKDRESDQGRTEPGADYPPTVSLATVRKPGDGTRTD